MAKSLAAKIDYTVIREISRQPRRITVCCGMRYASSDYRSTVAKQ
jgi:hypothetical protein